MAETATLGTRPAVTPSPTSSRSWPFGVILRDIARGGLAGLVGRRRRRRHRRSVGDAPDRPPRSPNRLAVYGERRPDRRHHPRRDFAVLLFGGLFVGIFVGTIWVVVSPWLPRSLGLRVLAAIPLAIGLGAFGLVQGSNSDFIVLGFDPRVVVVLLGLVGLVGASMAVVDAWLDRRLPRARSSTRARRAGSTSAISVDRGALRRRCRGHLPRHGAAPRRDRPPGQRHLPP